MNKEAVYEHFHADERPFIDKVTDWIERCSRQHEQIESDFLDPRQMVILTSLVANKGDVQIHAYGGYEQAERQRAVMAPDYAYLSDDDVQISLLKVTSVDVKFQSLQHGDFLGAILGLGIKRDKIGDIHYIGEACYYIVATEMADYVRMQLLQVHSVHVHCELIQLNELEQADQAIVEQTISVASLRLDGIVSDAVRVSRAKIMAPIKTGKCKVNWQVVEDPSSQLKSGDIVSLRGFGRFRIIAVEENRKSGRFRVTIGHYV